MSKPAMRRRTMIASLLAGLAVGAPVLAAQRLPDYPGPRTDQQSVVTDSGLSLATYAMTDPQEQATYFGANVADGGIVPVWLSISNSTPDQSFIIDASEITIEGGAGVGRPSKADSVSHTGEDQAVANTAAYFGAYGFALIVIANSAMLEANEVKRSMIEKAFYSHTLRPGQSVSGFIFMHAPKGQPLAGTALGVTLRPVAAGAAAARAYHLKLVP